MSIVHLAAECAKNVRLLETQVHRRQIHPGALGSHAHRALQQTPLGRSVAKFCLEKGWSAKDHEELLRRLSISRRYLRALPAALTERASEFFDGKDIYINNPSAIFDDAVRISKASAATHQSSLTSRSRAPIRNVPWQAIHTSIAASDVAILGEADFAGDSFLVPTGSELTALLANSSSTPLAVMLPLWSLGGLSKREPPTQAERISAHRIAHVITELGTFSPQELAKQARERYPWLL